MADILMMTNIRSIIFVWPVDVPMPTAMIHDLESINNASKLKEQLFYVIKV